MFRVASTPSSCTPARAEKSTDHAGDRTPALVARGPRTRVLETVLDRPRLQILRILVEEVAGPSVDPHEIAEVVGELEVHRLVREVDAVGLRAQEELVAEVARL